MEIKSNNTVQAFWVLIGSLSAFGFSLLSSMILSRYLDKQDYGTYRQVMYVYNTLLVVFTLGLPRSFSYFLPMVEKEEAKSLISKINLLLIGLGLIMSFGLFFGSNSISILLKNPGLDNSLKYFSVVPLFLLPTLGLEGILATYQKTQFLAIYNFVSRVIMLICVIMPIIWFNGNLHSAIIGFSFSSFLCFIGALILKFYPIRSLIGRKTSVTYRQIFNYTLPILGASIWGILINASDQFFISRYFGNEIFAEFANGSLELPFVSMIISSTAIVLSPIFVKQKVSNHENYLDEVLKLWNSVLSKTIKIIYPLVIFCICFADLIMILLYGNQYSMSGFFFQIKLFVNFFTIIAYAPLVLSIGGERYYFKVHMYGAVILILLEYFICEFFPSPYLVTVISVICQMGRIFAMLYFISKLFKISLSKLIPWKLVLDIVLPSFIVILSLRFILEQLSITSNLYLLTLSFILYAVIFYFWTKIRKIDYFLIVQPLINKLRK